MLGLAGLAISGYLVATHYGKQPIACAGVGDCEYVNSSKYASIGGVPVSLLGIGMYASLTAAALYWSRSAFSDKRMVAYWALALSGAGYAAYLTYVELDILHAICVWCVTSACVLTVSLALSTAALLWLPQAEGEATPSGAAMPKRPAPTRAGRRGAAKRRDARRAAR